MRFLVVGDSDSYIKWGAALASTLGPEWQKQLVVLASPVKPSPAQLEAALAATDFCSADAREVPLAELQQLIEQERPDVVLAALRGPVVRVVARAVRGVLGHRPVLLSGLPGITIPAARKAVTYRSHVDMVVLHSRREVREFSALAAEMGSTQRFGLATLPFIPADAHPAGPAASGSAPAGSAPSGSAPSGTDVIFASQAIVPREREDRLLLLGWLAELARRGPERRVVVKVRAVGGEAQTHAETYDFAELMRELDPPAPSNLVVEGGPMGQHLARAGALVTVSSTAAIEAVAAGIPVLLPNDFGVSPHLINVVFEGSGLFGDSEQLMAGEFHQAAPEWCDDNYLHGREHDSWVGMLDELVAANARATLPWRMARETVVGGGLRRAWDRRKALGTYDHSISGSLAWLVGVPLRAVVRRLRRIRAS
ncbi:hypothetical protein FB562_0544 [Homoserinimonas aerilata]|uniref:Uncharacterized protein n=1 Tax=Homoserinimonas aerilata TaxID=1162970 RepID=A0A542YHA3_9MICO|nr:DUF6716 putative glycosyltransferase [Homoserinimonas aerilata]TQL47483.1 hypothetical protein FB562_0544 [Homoserinimonas aerilata]